MMTGGTFNSDNEYLRLINKARVLEMPVLDLYDKNEHTWTSNEIYYIF